jgi:hypothetical protein
MSGQELERAILGALMLKPSLLNESSIRDVDFPSGQVREVFCGISEIWENAKPEEIDPVILAARIPSNHSATFIGSILDGSIRLDPETFRARLEELRKNAIAARIFKKISAQAGAGRLDLEEIRGELAEYDELSGKMADPSDFLMTGLQLQAQTIQVEWAVEKLIPARSLTLLHGPGGLGKTWLALLMSKAVSEGKPFLGLLTRQRSVVYLDYENPWPVLIERVRKLDIREAKFWHLSASVRPPKLDGPDWKLLKRLPAGSLIVIDTARAAHDGDENSSQDVGVVMGRLKEIREAGHEIILLHHTGKTDEKVYKGSTAWIDLSDHVLSFHKVRRGTLEEIEEGGFDPNALLRLGTGAKTRFEPANLYLSFDPSLGSLTLAQSPDTEDLDALAEYIAGPGRGRNQSEIFDGARKEGIGPGMRAPFLALLARGERAGRWRSYRGFRGSKIYEPTCP